MLTLVIEPLLNDNSTRFQSLVPGDGGEQMLSEVQVQQCSGRTFKVLRLDPGRKRVGSEWLNRYITDMLVSEPVVELIFRQ